MNYDYLNLKRARIVRLFLSLMIVLSTFTTEVKAQCLSAVWGQYPTSTFAPLCTGSPQTITTCGYAGEYSKVSVTSGMAYTFRCSNTSYYITIANNAGSVAYAYGVGGSSGITWVATFTGSVRFYTHTSSSCGSAVTCISRSVSCATAGPCVNTTSYGSATN